MARADEFRTVRLILHVPRTDGGLTHWCLIAQHSRRGVPTAHVVQRGMVPLPGPYPSEWQVWEALQRICDQYSVAD